MFWVLWFYGSFYCGLTPLRTLNVFTWDLHLGIRGLQLARISLMCQLLCSFPFYPSSLCSILDEQCPGLSAVSTLLLNLKKPETHQFLSASSICFPIIDTYSQRHFLDFYRVIHILVCQSDWETCSKVWTWDRLKYLEPLGLVQLVRYSQLLRHSLTLEAFP